MIRGAHGGIITGFLFRMVIIFALLGVAVYEAGAIIVAKVAVDGVSMDAAREAALEYSDSSGSTSKARRACERLARASGAECVRVRVEQGLVRVRVRKNAPTLIVHRIGVLRPHTEAEAEHAARIP